MKLIKDEQLLSNISESYTMLEEARKGMESYIARTLDELYNTVLDNQILLDKHDILDPRYNRLYYFFSAHINLDEVLVSCERQDTKTLELFK